MYEELDSLIDAMQDDEEGYYKSQF